MAPYRAKLTEQNLLSRTYSTRLTEQYLLCNIYSAKLTKEKLLSKTYMSTYILHVNNYPKEQNVYLQRHEHTFYW
jgi:hypothetical protein